MRIERELSSEDVAVRRRAARQLSELSGAARTRVITHALGDADVEVRLLAAQAGRVSATPGLGDRVVSWLTDPDARLRLSAAETLAEVPSPQGVPALMRALSDSEASVRRAAAAALSEAADVQAVSGLLGRLDDPAIEVREAAVRALAKLGDARAVVPLISKIEDPAPTVRQGVARALGELGDRKAVSALVLSLRDAEPLVRRAALSALSELGDTSVVPSIASLLPTEAHASVRRAAVDALSRLPSSASVAALVTTLGSFPEERERIIQAFARLESLALPALTQCVRGASDALLRDACAIAVSQPSRSAAAGGSSTAQPDRVAAASSIRSAFQASLIGADTALPALARLQDPEALSMALSFLTDSDPSVRRAALEASAVLLNPAQPDGRAVEPLELAFERGRRQRSERLELLRLLGRTGAERAARLLNPIARHADDLEFRVTALAALADLGVQVASETFLAGLEDPEARVRLASALALRRGGVRGLAGKLLERLEKAERQDREALTLALPGVLRSEPTLPDSFGARIWALLAASRDAERDALIESLAALPSSSALRLLAQLRQLGDGADRAKVMESLATRPDSAALLEAGLSDPEAAVRANAVWSSGWVFDANKLNKLVESLRDSDVNVAANAAAAIARLALLRKVDVRALLCGSLNDSRAAVRANALSGLRLLGSRCSDGGERRALERDRAPRVREAAAALLRDVPGASTADIKALRRCLAEEATASVALACGERMTQPVASGLQRAVLVFVVPEFSSVPVPRATFALRRPDGVVRFGQGDRRGAVAEFFVPEGPVTLTVLAAFEE